jgi:phosphoglycolate phosphatase-like HAD superfamily hydrolase
MAPKLFVWDFHGVLEKGNELAVLEISNQVLADHGYAERFTPEDNEMLYGRKWYQYFEFLLPATPHERHMELQQAAFAMSDDRPDIIAAYVRPNDHAHEVLGQIARSHRQIVISNTKPSALRMFIRAAGLGNFFNDDNAFAVDLHVRDSHRSKNDVLSTYLNANQTRRVVTIGDSASDMELAKSTGGRKYLYAHPTRKFKDCDADYRINDLRQVLQEL